MSVAGYSTNLKCGYPVWLFGLDTNMKKRVIVTIKNPSILK
jgi:hypothetical protein